MNHAWDRAKCWLDAGLALFYPEVCQVCGHERATVSEGFVGAGCGRKVRLLQPPFCARCGLPFAGDLTQAFECSNCRELDQEFSSARAAVAAQGMVLDVIHRYKYQRALWFEPFLVSLLVRQARPVIRSEEWDGIVPVPLHPLKEREREFNQAQRLAVGLGAALGLPVRTHWLARIQPTLTQTKLSRPERADNVRRAFAVVPGCHLHGERLIIVDDVFTTGATTNACARALKKAGAGRLCVWTVARGL